MSRQMFLLLALPVATAMLVYFYNVFMAFRTVMKQPPSPGVALSLTPIDLIVRLGGLVSGAGWVGARARDPALRGRFLRIGVTYLFVVTYVIAVAVYVTVLTMEGGKL